MWEISIVETLTGWEASATKGCCTVSKYYGGFGGNSLEHVHTLFKRYLNKMDRDVERVMAKHVV